MSLVAIAMSGGVDSSVSAYLLSKAGYQTLGLTMKLWSAPCDTEADNSDEIDPDKTCCTADSAMDARRVCDQLGIPHYTLDMQEDFRLRVVEPFVDSYLKAETPNPCVNCNSFVKWDALWEKARALGADFLATGHYAKTETVDGHVYIVRGDDPKKDQSYFLWGVPPQTLAKTLFPLGNLQKPEVRRLAMEGELRTAQKRESMDICFIPDGNTQGFLDRMTSNRGVTVKTGPIVDNTGKHLGTHQGLTHYTIGQRKGLGIASTEPLYVKELDLEKNTLILAPLEEILSDTFSIRNANWFGPEWDEERCEIQIRYRARARWGIVKRQGNTAHVQLEEKVSAITPGQSAVFYREGRLIGGGIIHGVVS